VNKKEVAEPTIKHATNTSRTTKQTLQSSDGIFQKKQSNYSKVAVYVVHTSEIWIITLTNPRFLDTLVKITHVFSQAI
jgi:hypothetical protein